MISRQCLLFVKHEKMLKLAKQVPILINSWMKYFRLKWCTCNCCIIDACQDMDGRMEGPSPKSKALLTGLLIGHMAGR